MGDDARDERLGRMLEVEPLDDLSRRRLVRTAMEASAPGVAATFTRRRRLVAAASLVAVVLAGGVAYLATRDTTTTQPTALADRHGNGADSTTSVAPNAATPSDASGTGLEKQASEAATNVADLGDFGDLATDAELRRVRSAFSAPSAGATNERATPAADSDTRAASLLRELQARPCADELPDGTVVAVGRAHFGTSNAIVVKTMQPDGSVSLDAVVADPCAVRPLD